VCVSVIVDLGIANDGGDDDDDDDDDDNGDDFREEIDFDLISGNAND
jgi:hypothetical protein